MITSAASIAVETYNLSMEKTLGRKVRIERITLGMNQAELAEKVGVSRGYISDIERDSERINIGKNTVIALAEALGISPAYLLGLTDNPLQGISDEDDSASTPPFVISPGTELLGIYQSLSSSNQSLLLTIAQRLKDADSPRVIGNE